MKIGDKVKVEITEGYWFVGTFIDYFYGGSGILIKGEKITIIAPKCECILVVEI